MRVEQLPLARQVEMVFVEIKEELKHLPSGTVFLQIRNNVVGKFGIKHLPLESKGGVFESNGTGLNDDHVDLFTHIAIQSLKYKKWTHGEISFDFRLKQETLQTSVQFESNYNLAKLLV
jgi:hypothetical protein